MTLQEIVSLLEKEGDLIKLLQDKIRAATVDKNPFLEILQVYKP
jgi:hypothetical protein